MPFVQQIAPALSGEQDSPTKGGLERVGQSQRSPTSHHFESIAAPDVDQITREHGSPIVETERVAMPFVKPTDCPCANSGEQDSPTKGGLERVGQSQRSPTSHHFESIAAPDVDQITREHGSPNLLRRHRGPRNAEYAGVTSKNAPIYVLERLPIAFGVTAGCRNE